VNNEQGNLKRMKRAFGIAVAVLIVVAFLYTLYYLYAKNQEPDVVFKTTAPFVTNIVQETVATGSVVPRKEIAIKPQVSGIIQKIYVQAGDQVKEGDVVAKIKVIPDMVVLNNAENRVERAKIDFENADIDFKRNKKLHEEEVISDAQFQQVTLNYKAAKQELDAAQDNLQIVQEGVSKKAGKISNTLIRATISGTVLDVPVEEGNSVIEANTFNEGTTIISVADLKDMIFEGKVDESEVGKLKTGMNIVLHIGAIEGENYQAVLEYIAPKGLDENGAIQFEIKAALRLKEGGVFVRAGYSANASIVLNKKDSVLAIKESVLHFSNDSIFVEVEKAEQRFQRRLVKLGLSDGINVEVVSGLEPNEKIKDPHSGVN
jgi:HlyD family secretion protein